MRFVTYNILHGAFGLEGVERTLRDLAPDVVFLQEVDRDCDRSGRIDQATELGRRLGLSASYAEAFPLGGGSYGIALLTRRPLTDTHAVRLPHPSPRQDDGSGEPRIALAGRLGALTLVCTHLGLSAAERQVQARAISVAFSRRDPLVLGGDLNEGPGESVTRLWGPWLHDAFVESGGQEATSGPPEGPVARIDHILRSAGVPAARRAFAGVAGTSDHRPVIVDLPMEPA